MSFHTGPGASPVTHEIGPVTLTKMSVGPMDNNVYLLTHRLGDTIIIDAAADATAICEAAGGSNVRAVVTTHEHHDHIGALETIHSVFPSATYLATAETGSALPIPTEKPKIGKPVEFGKITLEFITLRGHTPAGLAAVYRGAGETHIFTGDSLFPGGVGKTPSDQAFYLLFNDVRDRIFGAFDDATIIHPGHGDSTTVGAERPKLTDWEKRGW